RWVPLGVDVYRDRPADLHGAEHIVRDYRLAFVTGAAEADPRPFGPARGAAPEEGRGAGARVCLPFGFLFVSRRDGSSLRASCMRLRPTHPPTAGGV
ncbi:hypothetical protein THAOC_04639, partial [Thalassiosira oceanica]